MQNSNSSTNLDFLVRGKHLNFTPTLKSLPTLNSKKEDLITDTKPLNLPKNEFSATEIVKNKRNDSVFDTLIRRLRLFFAVGFCSATISLTYGVLRNNTTNNDQKFSTDVVFAPGTGYEADLQALREAFSEEAQPLESQFIKLSEDIKINNKGILPIVDKNMINENINLKIPLGQFKQEYFQLLSRKILSIVKSAKQKKLSEVQLAAMIMSESSIHGFDPLLVASIVQIESAFNHQAISNRGAQGLMQIMPTTKDFVENLEGIPPNERNDLSNPRYNIRLGISYLKYLRQKFNGSISLALMAYNWGPGHIDEVLLKNKRGVPSSVLKYTMRILEDHSKWHGQIAMKILF
jgi:GTP:adenosylcobinamide-phosphate guanylyltransferase